MTMENDENQNLIDDREEAEVGMEEIDAFDFDRAVQLMSVMEKVANVAPRSQAIAGLAQAALEEMNQKAKDLAKKRAEAFKELERKRDEALAAQRRDEEAKAKAEQEAAQEAADEEARKPVDVPPQRPAPRPNPETTRRPV